MPQTPDRFHDVREEDEIYFTSGSTVPSVNGHITYVQNQGFKFYQENQVITIPTGTVYDPYTVSHVGELGPFENILTSSIGAYREITGGIFPLNYVWYQDNTKTKKIFEKIVFRYANQIPFSISWLLYNSSGILIQKYSDTITYVSGVVEASRVRQRLL